MASQQGKLSHKDVHDLAKQHWDGVFRVEKHEARKGAAVDGKNIVQHWKILLHSSTGPVHWISELEDGNVFMK